MKKLFTLFIIIFATIASQAQVQPGYVKSIGRPDAPGKPLEGVLLRAKGAHNHIISAADGTFSLPLPEIKPGEAYSLQQIRKNGYELCEQGIIGRSYAFSDSVPLAITMLSTAQLQADKQRIEENAYRAAEKNYKKQATALERSRDANLITIEEYRAQMQALVDGFEKYQNLIDALSDHYARADYDKLDATEREINQCIEQGELDRADSLLHTIFDPAKFIARNQAKLEQLNTTIAQAETMLAQSNADLAAVLRRQEKDAEYLYHLYTIALARFDNEKARFYIETRAELDTTNYKWQFGAAKFIYEYVADYNKAMEYYNRALTHAIKQHGEENEWVALCYNNMANVYSSLNNYSKALDLLNKSIAINIAVGGEQNYSVSCNYNVIGLVYYHQGNFEKALEYYNKSLTIRLSVLGENNNEVATNYNNIALAYFGMGDYTKALDLYNKSLSIRTSILGENNIEVAYIYNNMALVHECLGNNIEALELHNKSLSIRIANFGKNHPGVATSYNNIALIYYTKGDNKKAIELFNKAQAINLAFFGETHSNVATTYNNIALVYEVQGDYAKALELYDKSFKIQLALYNENNPNIAIILYNIACIYKKQGVYNKALEEHYKSLRIQLVTLDENHIDIALNYSSMAEIYQAQGDFLKAQELYRKSLDIRAFHKDNNQNSAMDCFNLSMTYVAMENYPAALEYVTKSYNLFIKILPEEHDILKSLRQAIDFLKTKVNN